MSQKKNDPLSKYRGKTYDEISDLVYLNSNNPVSLFKSYVEFWDPVFNWGIFKDFTVEDKRKTMVDYVTVRLLSIKRRLDRFKEDRDSLFPLIPYGFPTSWVEDTVLNGVEDMTEEYINSMDDRTLNHLYQGYIDMTRVFLDTERITVPGHNYYEFNKDIITGDYTRSGEPIGEYILLTNKMDDDHYYINVVGVDCNNLSIVKNNYDPFYGSANRIVSEFNKFGKNQTPISEYPSSLDKTRGIKGFFSSGDGDLRLSESGNGGFHVSIGIDENEVDFSKEYDVAVLLNEDTSTSNGTKKVKVPVYVIPVDFTETSTVGSIEIALSPKPRLELIEALKTGNIDDFPFFTFNLPDKGTTSPTIPISIKCLPFKKVFKISSGGPGLAAWKFHTEVIYAFSPQG